MIFTSAVGESDVTHPPLGLQGNSGSGQMSTVGTGPMSSTILCRVNPSAVCTVTPGGDILTTGDTLSLVAIQRMSGNSC